MCKETIHDFVSFHFISERIENIFLEIIKNVQAQVQRQKIQNKCSPMHQPVKTGWEEKDRNGAKSEKRNCRLYQNWQAG